MNFNKTLQRPPQKINIKNENKVFSNDFIFLIGMQASMYTHIQFEQGTTESTMDGWTQAKSKRNIELIYNLKHK